MVSATRTAAAAIEQAGRTRYARARVLLTAATMTALAVGHTAMHLLALRGWLVLLNIGRRAQIRALV